MSSSPTNPIRKTPPKLQPLPKYDHLKGNGIGMRALRAVRKMHTEQILRYRLKQILAERTDGEPLPTASGEARGAGLGFDEATYRAAKPHFKALLADFQASGKSLKDFVRAIMEIFGSTTKPYLLRFAADLRSEQDADAARTDLERDSGDADGEPARERRAGRDAALVAKNTTPHASNHVGAIRGSGLPYAESWPGSSSALRGSWDCVKLVVGIERPCE